LPIENILDSDVFLVSYPRSGNTWVRNIIAEIIHGKSGKTLGEIGNFVPDIHVHKIEDMNLKHPRVIKSHFNYDETYKRVIYIVRDPRDVFMSYHKYLIQRMRYKNTLDNFIYDVCDGKIFPGTWNNHVNSWLFNDIRLNELKSTDFLMIKYENLIDETEKNILKIAYFLGKNLNKLKVKKIKYKTSRKKMKEKEKKGMFEWLPDNLEFVNEGSYGKWRGSLLNNLIEYITTKNKEEMFKLGYLDPVEHGK
jgi:hypothetical protein